MSLEEEDASLKDLVTKTLQSNGVLGKIQAQLRASVFLALEEEFKQKNIPLVNKWAQQLLSSREGTLAAALVQDFLQCLGFEFSLAVFGPESGQSAYWSFPGRQNVQSNLKLNGENGQSVPLLLELVKERQSVTQVNLLQSEGYQFKNQNQFQVNGLSSHVNSSTGNSKGGSVDSMLTSDIFLKPETQQMNLPTHNSQNISQAEDSGSKDSSDNSQSENSSSESSEHNIYKTSGFYLNKRNREDINQGQLEPLATNHKKGLNSNEKLPSWVDGKLGTKSADINEDVKSKSCDTPIPRLPLGAEVDDQKDTSDNSLSGCEKQYSEDFSSMSEKEMQEEEDNVAEEDIEEAEDIDEDISLDDLLSSNAS
ncbi:unnamed protein product, partial [Meganyctiphanes norvegica]